MTCLSTNMSYRVTKVNSYNGWDPLKQVVLGNCYSPSFFKDIPDNQLRNMMQTLMAETIEDLDNIQQTLEGLGVDVVRIPENMLDTGELLTNTYETFVEFMEKSNHYTLPKPMIVPRDYAITFGNKIFQSYSNGELERTGLFSPDVLDSRLWEKKKLSSGMGPFEYREFDENFEQAHKQSWNFFAPFITRFGDRLVVDNDEIKNLGEWIIKEFPEYKQTKIAIGGHSDGTFCPVKPGKVLCAPWMKHKQYAKTLPGWEIVNVDHPGTPNNHFFDWYDKRHLHQGKWWVEGANETFSSFVDQWLNKWVGYCEETAFEVNMLSISQEQILCLVKHEDVKIKLEKMGVEPIYCRYRHRHFWDGGLHCLTLDTVRDSKMESYF